MTLLVAADRVQETALNIGASTPITLLGAAGIGLQAFPARLDGQSVPYTIEHETSGQWEVGEGVYSFSSKQLLRTIVYDNSSGTTVPIAFAAGIVDVWIDLPAEKAVMLDADSNALHLPGALTAAGLITASAGATIASGQTLALAGATVSGAPTWSSAQAITLATAVQPNVTTMAALVSVGTLTAGVWNATPVTTAYGGTGLSSYNAGDTLYYASGTTLTARAIGAANSVGLSDGTKPTWAANLPYVTLPTGNGSWDTGAATTITIARNLTVTGTLTGTLTGSITGNAATATALQTARAINGVNFDGTAPITVTAAAGTLTGTVLASTVVTSSLTTVGTLGSLTVTGLITANGGITVASGQTLALAGATLSGAYTNSGTVAFTNASPFSLTNSQVVTLSTTAQTVGAATLTIPNFASVSDTFVFATLAQTLANKTLTSPAVTGNLIVTSGGVKFSVDASDLWDGTGTQSILQTYANASGTGPRYNFRSARGTIASPTATQNGDILGTFLFGGNDGSTYQAGGAQVFGQASQTWSVGANGSQLVFRTSPNGTTSSTQALLLGQDQTSTFAAAMTITSGNITASVGGVQTNPSAISRWDSTGIQTVVHTYVTGGGSGGPRYSFHAANGTVASPTATANNDALGDFLFAGYDGSNYIQAASIFATATQAWSVGANGGQL